MKLDVAGRWGVFDLDDTLGNLRDLLEPALIKATGIDLKWKDWYELKVELLYNIEMDQLISMLYEQNMIERMQPHPEAKDFLIDFKNKGGKIMILTARDWHSDAHALTTTWLAEHGIPCDELKVCGLFDAKPQLLGEMKPVVTVEDSVRHCLGYAKSGQVDNVYCYRMPWNVSGKEAFAENGVKYIDSLHEIEI